LGFCGWKWAWNSATVTDYATMMMMMMMFDVGKTWVGLGLVSYVGLVWLGWIVFYKLDHVRV